MLLAALVGGFTRQLWLEAERRQQETLDQVTRMSIANDLLHALHDVVQTLPSSLDLSDVVSPRSETFRELVDSTVAVVIVPDDTSDVWHVELAEGVRMPATLLPDELPLTLAASARDLRRHPGQRPRPRHRRRVRSRDPEHAHDGPARPRPRRRPRLDRAQQCRTRTPRRMRA